MTPVVEQALDVLAPALALGLLLASVLLETGPRWRVAFGLGFAGLALLAAGNFVNWGEFHGRGREVHAWEQFHFFLGSKYLRELRYDAIYEAAILAGVERGRLEPSGVKHRDPLTFRMKSTPLLPRREAEIRRRFTPQRWRAFGDDAQFFMLRRLLTDHGNTDSPAAAALAGLFTGRVAADATSARWLARLDLAALAILFAMAGWAFGRRAMLLAMIVGLSAPLAYAYLGGSILRMSWLCALGASVCLFEKRWYRAGGLLLGYAVTAKLLAGLIVLPFGLRFVVQAIRERRVDQGHLRYILYAVLGTGLCVVAAGLYFGDLGLWQDYARRLVATFHERYYFRQHSLRDLFLQAVHEPGSLWQPFPATVAASKTSVRIENVLGAFVFVQLVLLAGLVFVAVRQRPRVAFALGPLAVFVLLVSNMYYWPMWLVAAIVLAPTYRTDYRHAAFLGAILAWLAAGQLFQWQDDPVPGAGYFGSYGLFWIGVLVVGGELVAWIGRRRKPPGGGEGRAMNSTRSTPGGLASA